MHCGIKRRHSSTLEHIDIEHQQQSLFDLSIFKLQQEQLRPGVEPRLLRFVLINNALRALQGHIMLLDEDDTITFDCDLSTGETCSNTSDSFLSNTFKDGGLSTPLSTPTPIKKIKLDNTLIDKSPLIVTATPFHDDENETKTEDDGVKMNGEFKGGGGVEGGGGDGVENGGVEGAAGGVAHLLSDSDKSVLSEPHSNGVQLGKRTRASFESENEEKSNTNTTVPWCEDNTPPDGEQIATRGCETKSKRLCKPSALHMNGTKRLNGLNGIINGFHSSSFDIDHFSPPNPSSSPTTITQHNHNSPSDESDEEYATTPSPIDFTKVDPTLYDYDTKTTLLLPGHDSSNSTSTITSSSTTSLSTPSSSSSSSSQAASQVPVTISPTAKAATPIPNSLPMTLAITTASVTNTTSCLPTTQVAVVPASSTSVSSSSCNSSIKVVESSSSFLTTTPVVPSTSSCSMQGIVSAQNEPSDDERTASERSISTCSNGVLPTSPKGLESDFLEADIEHIVSLLMT